MTAWRTLKDVPRDGRPVLLWGPERSDVSIWAWNEDERCWDADHERRPVVDTTAHFGAVFYKTALDSEFVLWAPITAPD